MSLIKDVAIALRRLDYSESSQVLVMFTRDHGQQRLIAKGIKRSTKTKAAVGIDLLEMGRVVFSDRPGKEDQLAILTEWRQEDSFAPLRLDLRRCYAGQYAAEVTAQLTEIRDPHPGLFDALRKLLTELGDSPPLLALDAYLWRLLTEIGLRPELGRCMSCGRSVSDDKLIYFSSREGGAICRDCEPAVVDKRRVSGVVLQWLIREAAGESGPAAEAFDLLDHHLTQIMHRPARLAAPLRQAMSGR